MAARYWVGGTATWDATAGTKWSTTSGGAGGASVPTSVDQVLLNAASGTNTITVDSGAVCAQLTMTGFTGTLAFGTNSIEIAGNASVVFNQPTTMSVTGTPVVNLTYAGSTGTRTITGSTILEANAISVNITAGTDTIGTTTLRVKNLNFTGFSGTLSNSARIIYGNLTFSAGMTLTAGTAAITFSATSGTQQITTNSQTIDFPLTFNGVGGTFAFQDALTQGSTRAFTITNGTVQLKAGVTSTVGSLVTSGTTQKFLQSTTPGSRATLSQVTGIVSTGYLTIRDINATGGATFNAYTVNSNVNAGNNLGWDFFAQLGKTIYTRRKEKRVLI